MRSQEVLRIPRKKIENVKRKMLDLKSPGVVKGANFIGIEGNMVAFLVAVIGGVRAHMGHRGSNQNRENEED